jgi:tryptophan 2-monooxygenase
VKKLSGELFYYELMKIGLHPVVYESARNADGTPRIGGRMYTYRFPGDPKALAELGAMRFPPTQRTFIFYVDKFGLDYSRRFPDPLVVPTSLFFKGQKYFIPVNGKLPPDIQRAVNAWKAFIRPLVDKMLRVRNKPQNLNSHYFVNLLPPCHNGITGFFSQATQRHG